MIEIEIRRLGDHEILHATPTGKRDKPLPVVVFYHGFTSSKLVYSYFAVALAQAGVPRGAGMGYGGCGGGGNYRGGGHMGMGHW